MDFQFRVIAGARLFHVAPESVETHISPPSTTAAIRVPSAELAMPLHADLLGGGSSFTHAALTPHATITKDIMSHLTIKAAPLNERALVLWFISVPTTDTRPLQVYCTRDTRFKGAWILGAD